MSQLTAIYQFFQLLTILVFCKTIACTSSPHQSKPNCKRNETGSVPAECSNDQVIQLDTAIAANSKLCENVSVSEYVISRDVFGKHQPWERPLINGRKPIEIEVRLVLSSVNDLIEKEKIIKLTGYLLFYWYDEFHVWNKTFPHACLSSVIMPQHNIWIPEIAMINSEQHYELLLMHNEEMVRVSSNGYVSYRPGGTFRAYCDYDLTFFPFDFQTCSLILESWRYTVDFQRFHFGDTIQRRYWLENEQWLLLNTSQRVYNVQYVVATNVFSRVEFTLTLKRKVAYYLINIIIPSVIISVAEIATFTLPVEEEMKIHISFTCLLAYGIFQLMIIEDIPRTSEKIPMLSYYITLSMGYICLAMMGEGLVFVCVRKGNDRRHKQYVPDFFFKIACVIGKLLHVRKPVDQPVQQSQIRNKDNPWPDDYSRNTAGTKPVSLFASLFDADKDGNMLPSKMSHQEHRAVECQEQAAKPENRAEIARKHRWEFLADVIDRLSLVVYIFFILITPFTMFLIVPYLINY